MPSALPRSSGGKDRNDDGEGGRHDHRAAHPLQKAQGDHRFDRPGLGEQPADEGEDDDAVLEDAPPAVDVAHAPHGQQEDRGRQHVGGFHQPELHGAGRKLATDGRQGHADRRHHEGHEEVGGADDQEGRRAGNLLGHLKPRSMKCKLRSAKMPVSVLTMVRFAPLSPLKDMFCRPCRSWRKSCSRAFRCARSCRCAAHG